MTVNHHHFWRTRSSHATSEGLVSYQSCPCGRWRILATEQLAEIARPTH